MSDGPRHSLETIRRALDHISPDCDREQWVRVLAGVKSELGDDGRELAQAWSARGATYKASAFRSAWKSLRPDGGVTIGTVLALAKDGGFLSITPSGSNSPLPPDHTAEREAREAREEALRQKGRDQAAAEAARRFAAASESGSSPYLERKAVRAHGVRFEGDCVLVPMRNAAGKLRNLQVIAADGEKRFLPRGQAVDLCHWLGDPTGAAALAIAEGYATAATIHEATGLPVACAFNAGNLGHVARQVRELFPAAQLVICADDDRETHARSGRNPGLRAAREAAKGKGAVAIPAPLEAGETDFNDLARRVGLEAVAAIVRAALERGRASKAADSESGTAVPKSENPPDDDDGDPFRVTARGVYYRARNNEGKASLQWVCGPLTVEARTRDVDGGSWGYLLAFTDPEGTLKRLALPARLLAGDAVELRARLLDEGLAIAAGPAKSRLAHYLMTRPAARLVRCVETVGWHGDAFVLPAKSYGPAAAEMFYQTADERPRNAFKHAGTLADWRANVAARCIANPRLAFAVALSFAGPCVHLLEALSGGFHFHGRSSTGKTTAAAVGASVWGRPEIGAFLKTWRATGNALEATAAAHSDTVLILDELREAQPAEIVSTVMMLGNGVGKQRMRAGGAPRASHAWRLLFLSTGERGIADLAALANVPVDAGAGVRLVEIPIPANGVFDVLHGATDAAAFAESLRSAALAHYGTAGDAWLEYLTAHRAEGRDFLRDCSSEWLAAELKRGTDAGQVQRVGARFALIAAAGELATRAGLTGWPAGEAERAARRLFSDWIAARGTRGDAEALAALRQVAHMLAQHGESYFPLWHRAADDHRPNAPKRWGVRRMVDELGNEIESRADRLAAYGDEISEKQGELISARFYVLVTAFRDEIAKGFDPKYVARVLHDHKHLTAESEVPGARLDRKERLPGIGPARCYVIKPSIFADPSL